MNRCSKHFSPASPLAARQWLAAASAILLITLGAPAHAQNDLQQQLLQQKPVQQAPVPPKPQQLEQQQQQLLLQQQQQLQQQLQQAQQAQQQGLQHGAGRNFPANSQRGELKVRSQVEATVNGDAVRLAPGLRIFNPQNQLVFAHSVAGQELQVRYVIEASTGMLLTAWILTKQELDREPKKSLFRW